MLNIRAHNYTVITGITKSLTPQAHLLHIRPALFMSFQESSNPLAQHQLSSWQDTPSFRMPASKDNPPYRLIDNFPIPQLRSREDWPLWKEYIESTTKLCGVWEYCDPAAPDDKALELGAKIPSLPARVSAKMPRKFLTLTMWNSRSLGHW